MRRRDFIVSALSRLATLGILGGGLFSGMRHWYRSSDGASVNTVEYGNSNAPARLRVTEVLRCPRRMSYEEYIGFTGKFVDWPKMERKTAGDLASGLILRCSFRFDGETSTTVFDFASPGDYERWNSSFTPDLFTAGPYPAEVTLQNLVLA